MSDPLRSPFRAPRTAVLRRASRGGPPRRAAVAAAAQAVVAMLAGAAAAPLAAQSLEASAAAETIVVTGSIAERRELDAPYAIGVVDREVLRQAGPMINLSEAMARVPGIVVANRSNFAQDLQVTSRGFGARAGFGIRGLRLIADGIPASGPDGQGQVSHIDLASAERIEVLRGPFSALYGNSSGGVVSVFSAPVRRAEAEAGVDLGSYGLRQLRAAVQTPLGAGFEMRVSGSTMDWEGFRPHSEAERELANVRVGWRGDADTVTAVASHYEQPADDPLGLKPEQFADDPRQTTPEAGQYDTRKRAKQDQLGVNWRHRFAGAGALREFEASAYAGRRSVTQWLAISKTTQDRASHGGGVSDFDRDYRGAQAQLRWGWETVDAMAGAAVEDQRDERRGYENYVLDGATPVYGGIGTPRRDEIDRARTTDVFGQAEWRFAPRWSASAGLRAGRVELSADDRYLSNGDDSGDLSYGYANPVLGLRWQAAPGLNLHAAFARGFESPTLGELAYRADGSGGFNEDLSPQKSRQFELGAKWRRDTLDLDAVLFQTDVDDEIGIASNAGGRSSFQNVGRTKRRGAELAAGWRPAPAWSSRLALTLLDARYRDDFETCSGIPCAAPDVRVPAGNRIAGTQRASAFAEVAWRSAALGEWGVEWRAAGRTAANDRNTDFAAGYGVAALRFSRAFALGAGQRIEVLARVDNLFDRDYVGSLIVNDANRRFFETGSPRSALLALRWVGAL